MNINNNYIKLYSKLCFRLYSSVLFRRERTYRNTRFTSPKKKPLALGNTNKAYNSQN